MGAPHNDRAANSQYLAFQSRCRHVYCFANGKGSWSPKRRSWPRETSAQRTIMKRGIAVLLSLCVLVGVAYFTASKWAIRHQTMTFYDASRDNRPVAVDVAI